MYLVTTTFLYQRVIGIVQDHLIGLNDPRYLQSIQDVLPELLDTVLLFRITKCSDFSGHILVFMISGSIFLSQHKLCVYIPSKLLIISVKIDYLRVYTKDVVMKPCTIRAQGEVVPRLVRAEGR